MLKRKIFKKAKKHGRKAMYQRMSNLRSFKKHKNREKLDWRKAMFEERT